MTGSAPPARARPTAHPGSYQRKKAFGHAVMGVSRLPIERSLPVLAEGSQPDVLFRLGPFRMPVIASSSLCSSDVGPARRPVDGAGVAWDLDEGLDQHGRGVVALGPVPGQALADDGEDVRAEVGDLDPGVGTNKNPTLWVSRLRFIIDSTRWPVRRSSRWGNGGCAATRFCRWSMMMGDSITFRSG